MVLIQQSCEIKAKEMDFKCSNPEKDVSRFLQQSISVERTNMLRE